MKELGFPHTVLSALSRPPGYKKVLQYLGRFRTGKNLLDRDWDLCVVLDACRADLLWTVLENDEWSPPRAWSWDTLTSVDSHTVPWAKKTFSTLVQEDTIPTTYVTATPQSAEIDEPNGIVEIDEVWRYGWEDSLGTVPPDVVTDRAIHRYRTGTDRVMVHYLQPHVPLLERDNGELRPLFAFEEAGHAAGAVVPPIKTEGGSSSSREISDVLPGEWDMTRSGSDYLFDRLRDGDVDRQTAWNGYKETLLIALDSVTTLLRSVDAETVVITADHGNAFGEWGLYGHPYHMPVSVLREVPYVTTSATVELDYEPAEYERDSDINRRKQLEALGYQ